MNWKFQFGVQSEIDVPILVTGGFMQRDQLNEQQQNNDTS